MKIVISDTSPINYLVLIGKQDILPALFDRIIGDLLSHGLPAFEWTGFVLEK